MYVHMHVLKPEMNRKLKCVFKPHQNHKEVRLKNLLNVS